MKLFMILQLLMLIKFLNQLLPQCSGQLIGGGGVNNDGDDDDEDYSGEDEEEEEEEETAEEKAKQKSILQDSYLSVDKLIEKYGYKAETHYCTTTDGYILALHRLRREGAQPFLLQHGLVDSSAGFVIMGPNISLAYYLSDNNYDVWLGNARGNRYSRNHTTLDPDGKKFWDFSWHEIGIYDLPAMIDYILKTTQYERLYYAGHSQGCTAFFVMCSMRPEYNNKIIMMQALAPAVYANETKHHPYIRAINLYFNSPVGNSVSEMFNNEFRFLCRMTEETERLCIEAVFAIVGRNWDEFNRKMFPIILGHYPAGVAAKQVKHFIQVIRNGRFAPYNYNKNKNQAIYRQQQPPAYNLTTITVPTYIYYSENDMLCHAHDVEAVYHDLGNAIGKYLVPKKNFNHMDFLWAINVRNLLYGHMLTVVKQQEKLNLITRQQQKQ